MKKRHGAEQIVAKLRQADAELGKGLKVPEVCKQLGITVETYYRRRQKYGGMAPEMASDLPPTAVQEVGPPRVEVAPRRHARHRAAVAPVEGDVRSARR